MRELNKKSSIKISKTYTGQIPADTGFNGKGGSYIRNAKKVLKEQKKNGLQPISFNPETGEMKYL